jgi:VanZ family protein
MAAMTATPPARQFRSGSLWRQLGLYLALAGYALLIGYGSLYPFASWRVPDADALLFLLQPPPSYITRTDTTTNILAYLPFGLMLARALSYRVRPLRAVLLATVTGISLSLVMEVLQMFVPGRVSSNLDILANGLGTLIGAVAAGLVKADAWPGRMLIAWRQRWFLPGWLVNVGVALLGLWALSQFSLQLPSLVAGRLHTGFIPFWELPADWSRFNLWHALIYVAEVVALGLFAATLVKPGLRRAPFLWAMMAVVLLFKMLAAAVLLKLSVLARLFSLEALLGLGLGFLLLFLVMPKGRERLYAKASGALVVFVLARVLYWAWTQATEPQASEWPPSSGSLFNITGLAYVTSVVWPFLALAYLGLRGLVTRHARSGQ